jgi:hypothetical protein
MPNIEELRAALNAARESKSKIESEKYAKKSALEAELNRTIYTLFGDRIREATNTVNLAAQALQAESDRITLESVKTPWPVGTLMAEWKYLDRYQQKPGLTMKLAGEKGRIEIVTRETVHPENIASYARAMVGQVIIRLLRKNGEVGKTYVTVPNRTLAELTDPSKSFLWRPFGEDLNAEYQIRRFDRRKDLVADVFKKAWNKVPLHIDQIAHIVLGMTRFAAMEAVKASLTPDGLDIDKLAASAAASEVIFHCSASHYSDRPHLFNGPDEWHVHDGEAPPNATIIEKTCREHRKPVEFSATDLFAAICHADGSFCPELPDVFVPLPEFTGWTGAVGEDRWGYGDKALITPTFTAKSPDGITITLRFYGRNAGKEKPASYDSKASGHTSFTTSQGVRTFDRTGVEDSFYLQLADTVEDVLQRFRDQIKRVAESRARIDRSESIPGLGFLATPELKAQVTAELKAGKSHSFTPSGFGTGYRLYTGRQQSRFDHRAKAETEAFFGVSPIYLQTMDCD